MKVLHALGWYFPEDSGGTEVYVQGLVECLRTLRIQGQIAAAQPSHEEKRYLWEGTEVYRYPVFPDATTRQVRGYEPHGGFDQFERWLMAQPVDIYHQHSWSLGCGLAHLRAAKALGKKTVMTVHVPGLLCLRGTMRLHGQEPCDGRLSLQRCASCWASSRGIPQPLAALLPRLPLRLSRLAAHASGFGRLLSGPATAALVDDHQQHIRDMIQLSDRIVAVCEWLYQVLLANGVPKEKLVLSRQGVWPLSPPPARRRNPGPLRVGYVGRCSAVKGIHLVIEAVRRLPKNISMELILHLLPAEPADRAYELQLKALAQGDTRISFAPAIPHEQVVETLTGFDVLAVPSQWLETGPYVVIEALAAGTPVLGSDLGGIREWIRQGEQGWLLSADDSRPWTEAFRRLINDPSLLDAMRQRIGPVRTMADAANDMAAVYRGMP